MFKTQNQYMAMSILKIKTILKSYVIKTNDCAKQNIIIQSWTHHFQMDTQPKMGGVQGQG